MLKRFEYFYYPPMSTPYDSKIHFVKNHGDGVFARKIMHKSLVAWCFDKLYGIAYIVSKLSRYTHNHDIEPL
jgi:hypothetical protein